MRIDWPGMKYRDPKLAGLRRIAAAIVMGLFAVGCGSTVEGVPERASGQEGLFNPCTDIPDSVIEEVGLDPSTELIDIDGVEQPGWKMCMWKSTWYFFTIMSTKYTLDDVRSNSDYTKFDESIIADRVGLWFQRESDETIDGCYLAFAASQGSVWLNIEADAGTPHQGSTCGLVESFALQLVSSLPR
ncbi:UNVERIFIED_ORG: uncharacterized protein DUF3558 [Nocardia globerula]|uniref:Uncharacterized protein DUF3558 n=1 Tax=Nocardia globerula TaxID=1818 RepID=A0A652YIM0_NOCGL|nr:DUF3558 domain-containing protein [Rhodococcus globerulus]PVX66712.1 uncharacterized protein DUF3558 [Rhodococcus globerulus]